MAEDDFNARLARIAASRDQGDTPAAGKVTAAGSTGAASDSADLTTRSQLRPLLAGAGASAVVVTLFFNIQAISDLAPDWVRNSQAPGAFGLPIALLTILWFVAIPVWFVTSVVSGNLKGKGFAPSPFVLGAFAALAVGVVAMKLWPSAAP